MFIVADDLGFNELGYRNSTRGLHTPHIDALASEGVILDHYYTQPICSPARSALMTGRYPIRLGTQSNVIFWNTPWGISLDETFLPQNLKDVGYKTAMYGKWHLGMFTDHHLPPMRGFDEFHGFGQGCGDYYLHEAGLCGTNGPWGEYVGYDWFNNITIDTTTNGTISSTLIKDRAVSFLEAAAKDPEDTPWFLYLPFQNIHEPFEADPEYIAMCDSTPGDLGYLRTICGMLAEFDARVGDIITALKASGEYDNTIIFFVSDNGAPPQGDVPSKDGYLQHRDWPLRGWKTQVWEGGIRVPSFVHSPLLAKPGRVSNELIHITDWLPTIVNLAGGSVKRNNPLDGHDVWSTISEGAPSPRTEILHNINPLATGQAGKPKAAIRSYDMKLLCEGYDGVTAKCTGDRYLFNITADPSETNNLATSSPEIVSQLETRLAHYNAGSVTPMQWDAPFQGKDYWCAACPNGTQTEPYHAWRPWIKAPPHLVQNEA